MVTIDLARVFTVCAWGELHSHVFIVHVLVGLREICRKRVLNFLVNIADCSFPIIHITSSVRNVDIYECCTTLRQTLSCANTEFMPMLGPVKEFLFASPLNFSILT